MRSDNRLIEHGDHLPQRPVGLALGTEGVLAPAGGVAVVGVVAGLPESAVAARQADLVQVGVWAGAGDNSVEKKRKTYYYVLRAGHLQTD